MARRMLDLLTLLSLLVCVAAGAAQVSHWFYGDYLLTVRETTDGAFVARVGGRDIRLMHVDTAGPIPRIDMGARTVLDVPVKLLTTLGGILPAMWLGRRPRRTSVRHGHCNVCGYDLRATPGTCPVCGTPAGGGYNAGVMARRAAAVSLRPR